MHNQALEQAIRGLLNDGSEWGVNAIAKALGIKHPNTVLRYLNSNQSSFKQLSNKKWVLATSAIWPREIIDVEAQQLINNPIENLGKLLKRKARNEEEIKLLTRENEYWTQLAERAVKGDIPITETIAPVAEPKRANDDSEVEALRQAIDNYTNSPSSQDKYIELVNRLDPVKAIAFLKKDRDREWLHDALIMLFNGEFDDGSTVMVPNDFTRFERLFDACEID